MPCPQLVLPDSMLEHGTEAQAPSASNAPVMHPASSDGLVARASQIWRGAVRVLGQRSEEQSSQGEKSAPCQLLMGA